MGKNETFILHRHYCGFRCTDVPDHKTGGKAWGWRVFCSGSTSIRFSFDQFTAKRLAKNLVHPLSILLLQIVSIIIVSRAFGYIFNKIGQPTVIGEIVAGIVLGPALLGLFFPEASAFLLQRIIAEFAISGSGGFDSVHVCDRDGTWFESSSQPGTRCGGYQPCEYCNSLLLGMG